MDSAKNGQITQEGLPSVSDFPVVGIGASAGGLETFTKLLGFLPTDSGMAFILVQHLNPTHPSLLAEILSRATKIPVVEVEDSVKVLPNRIYVMPSNRDMVLSGGKLRTEIRKSTYGMPDTIDTFFGSLAEDAQNRAIGIILSGTGSDGAHGITQIKAEGGITIAQEVSSAKFGDMPRNAIATDCVDFVLPTEGIARELLRIAQHPYVCDSTSTKETLEVPEKSGDATFVVKILQIVRKGTGIDFSAYKRNTIMRRISRRMVLCRKENLRDYAELLTSDSSEVHALYRDLLIGVTSFFRDPETFEVLKNQVFPEIVKHRDIDNTIRIWVAGCATGEEVYSIAMCLIDFLDESKARFPVQIFGTDVSDLSIDKARAGLFRESSIATIPPDYLKRFFTKADNGYQISKNIRDVCVFARQNVVTDPPFSSLDLISCRNVLIYLEAVLQKRVISLFHYALKSTGFLVLGNAESAGAYPEFFSERGKYQKVYSKKAGLEPTHFDFARRYMGRDTATGKSTFAIEAETVFDGQLELERETNKALASRVPIGATINEHCEVIQLRGQTGLFLEAPSGPLTNDILKMARPGLRGDLAKAIHQAQRDDIRVEKNNLRIKHNKGFIDASLEVIPFHSATSKNRFFAIVFSETRSSAKSPKPRVQPDDGKTALLEKELADTQEYLQSLVEKERSASHDLRAVNEEILSSNEEMQSSNEELETAKEELQSSNEELATVNDELNHRNRALSELNSDLNNLLSTVHVPVIMLSRDLIIRRYSALAETLISLKPSDVGRSIRDFKTKLKIPDLVEIVSHVIENVTEHAQEIQDDQGRWFSLRIRPYQTLDNKIDGAIIALIDIGTLKGIRDYAEGIVRTIRESLVVLDSDLRVRTANPAFYRIFSTSPELVEKKLIYEIDNGEWNRPELRTLLEKILPKDTYFHDFQMLHHSLRNGDRTLLLNASRLRDGSKDGDLILLAIEDITERSRALSTLTETADALGKANLELEQFATAASHDLQEPLRMVSSFMQLLSKKYAGKLDSVADEYIRVAVEGAKRMQLLVQDLLHFSQCGKGELRHDLTDCSQVLNETIAGLNNLIEETHSKVSYDPLPMVPIDGILLSQVFQNLITNAIKFRNSRDPQIHISSRSEGADWEFSVKDNGIGIEKRFIERIFLIFQRLHTKEAYAGTGVGLATCKKIIERYGGRIWVESEPGTGSTFFFTVPSVFKGEGRITPQGRAS